MARKRKPILINAAKGVQANECTVGGKAITDNVVLVIPAGFDKNEALNAARTAVRRLENMDISKR